MTTYRERRLAKAERLREWAASREGKAAAAAEWSHAIAGLIPFGQPILAGHHSQRRAERDQRRIQDGAQAAVEHGRKAEEFARRADSIEAAAEHAIYSDDADAAARLEERIAELEAERDRIKRYNATCRKGTSDPALLDERQRTSLEGALRVQPFACRGGAFPGYALANLSGNIARNRKRLEGLRREQGASIPRVGPTPDEAIETTESGQLALGVPGEQRSLLPLPDPPATDETEERP